MTVHIIFAYPADSLTVYCRDYLTNKAPVFSVSTSSDDIGFEKQKSIAECTYEGIPYPGYSPAELENTAVYRKIAEKLPEYNAFVFHGSAVAVGNKAYLFTAKSVRRDAVQTKARREITDALHSRGIYTLEVQGTRVKQYYPQSFMRMMSDMDFIVSREQFDGIDEIIRGLGYETRILNGNEINASKGDIHVEIHTEFFDSRSIVGCALSDPFSHVTLKDGYTAEVSDTVFYLFHLLHTIKHCMQNGSGFRRIIDLYYLENALEGSIDRDEIDRILKENGFLDAKLKLIDVMNHWFYGKEPERDVSDLESDIKSAGNHGTADLYLQHKFDHERAEGKHFVKLKYFLCLIFLTKEKLYSYYPVLEQHNLPVFICRIYRFYRLIKNRNKLRKVRTVIRNLKEK